MTNDPNGAGGIRAADAATNDIVMEALEADKREALMLALKARWVALAVTAVLLPILNPTWLVLYYEAILVLFALNGWLQMRIGRVGQSRPELLLLFVDLALMTFTLVVPNPFVDYPWPTAMQYRFDGFAYFFIFLAGGTLAYSWRTVFAIGTWTSGLWVGAAILVWLFGSTYPDMTDKISAGLADYPQLLEFLDPNDIRFPRPPAGGDRFRHCRRHPGCERLAHQSIASQTGQCLKGAGQSRPLFSAEHRRPAGQ